MTCGTTILSSRAGMILAPFLASTLFPMALLIFHRLQDMISLRECPGIIPVKTTGLINYLPLVMQLPFSVMIRQATTAVLPTMLAITGRLVLRLKLPVLAVLTILKML